MWLTAIIAAIAKLIDIIPVQGREERWRNELDNIKKERAKLLKGKADTKKAQRIAVIDERIEYLTQLLKNMRAKNLAAKKENIRISKYLKAMVIVLFISFFCTGCTGVNQSVPKTPKAVAMWWGSADEIKIFLDSPQAQADQWLIQSLGE